MFPNSLSEREGRVEMAPVGMTFGVMACHSAGTFSVKQVICKVKWIHSQRQHQCTGRP